MGTPEFAVPVLEAVAERVAKPVLVVSQPDRPKGRGRGTVEPTPVKACATRLGLPLCQPARIKTPEFAEELARHAPDLVVVAAYGRILTEKLLAAPRLGCVNVHASLLPAYRGAAPINWAIINGETRTGVTVQKMAAALDAGVVLHVKETGIGPDETAGDLYGRLSALGAEAIVEFFEKARFGIETRPQDEAGVSFAPPLSKSDGLVDWSKPARAIHNLVRGTSPWPGAQAKLGGVAVKIHRSRLQIPNPKSQEKIAKTPGQKPQRTQRAQRCSKTLMNFSLRSPRSLRLMGFARGSQVPNCLPGEVVSVGRDCITVATGEGVIDLLEIQAEGARRLAAADFARGRRIVPGVRFG
ncbi:MAG: methionyl-tRNA formyltransferase [Deltaproteobacteria bacterium]|nr:methionyl-tRNA formyltransferase [Deltaproteobacteria bacterium]